MNEKIIALLVEFVTHVIDAGGYAGIVALMGIESACIPLPSEIIMPFAGYLIYQGHFNLFWVATAGAVGCNVGSAIAYWIGAKGGRPLVERYGKWVLMNHRDLDRMTEFFSRYGSITVLVASSHFPRALPRCRKRAFTFTHFWGRGRGASRWPMPA
jgi:membrane protein DedA with SNARE-associated domain